MGPTIETRSRDEWLAEVKRRGGRLRRRRQLTMAFIGALAMMLPFSAMAGFLTADSDLGRQLSVAGPPPAPGHPQAPAGADDVIRGSDDTLPEPTTTSTLKAEPPAEAVPGRTQASTADDPVVRMTTTTAPLSNSSTPSQSPTQSTTIPLPSTTVPAAATLSDQVQCPCPEPVTCPKSDVRVIVTTDKAVYAQGETVRGWATLENRSASACRLPTEMFLKVQNGVGKVVGDFSGNPDFQISLVDVQPGGTSTTTAVTWNARDCSGSACLPLPPGTYAWVADYFPYDGVATFQISG